MGGVTPVGAGSHLPRWAWGWSFGLSQNQDFSGGFLRCGRGPQVSSPVLGVSSGVPGRGSAAILRWIFPVGFFRPQIFLFSRGFWGRWAWPPGALTCPGRVPAGGWPGRHLRRPLRPGRHRRRRGGRDARPRPGAQVRRAWPPRDKGRGPGEPTCAQVRPAPPPFSRRLGPAPSASAPPSPLPPPQRLRFSVGPEIAPEVERAKRHLDR